MLNPKPVIFLRNQQFPDIQISQTKTIHRYTCTYTFTKNKPTNWQTSWCHQYFISQEMRYFFKALLFTISIILKTDINMNKKHLKLRNKPPGEKKPYTNIFNTEQHRFTNWQMRTIVLNHTASRKRGRTQNLKHSPTSSSYFHYKGDENACCLN